MRERGLKRRSSCRACGGAGSLPMRERGLKPEPQQMWEDTWRRSPRGERGLKRSVHSARPHDRPSLPMRGAWIDGKVGARSASEPKACFSAPVRLAWLPIDSRCHWTEPPRRCGLTCWPWLRQRRSLEIGHPADPAMLRRAHCPALRPARRPVRHGSASCAGTRCRAC